MTDQSIEDASRREFEKKFNCDGLVFEEHSVTSEMVYSPANAQISQSWTLANLRNNQWTAWQAARQSSQSEPVANKQTPYANCQFQICDLPGQCKGAGRCHHPITVADVRNNEPVAEVLLDENQMKYIKWNAAHWTHILSAGSKLYLAAPQQAIPSGWKLVPIAPTDEMKQQGWEAYRDSNKPAPYNMLTDAYKAMLSASPTAPIESDK
jgi:hypothetical protein